MINMGVSKIGVPQNGWFIMENPIKINALGGPPLFLETPILIIYNIYIYIYMDGYKKNINHSPLKSPVQYDSIHPS